MPNIKRPELSTFAVDLKNKGNVLAVIEHMLKKSNQDLIVLSQGELIELMRLSILKGKVINVEQYLKDDKFIMRMIEDYYQTSEMQRYRYK